MTAITDFARLLYIELVRTHWVNTAEVLSLNHEHTVYGEVTTKPGLTHVGPGARWPPFVPTRPLTLDEVSI